MEEIIEDYEQGGREESGYVVMDVRGKCGAIESIAIETERNLYIEKLHALA